MTLSIAFIDIIENWLAVLWPFGTNNTGYYVYP